MAKIKPLTINNFQKGIAASSYFGFEEFRGLNINDKPGIAFANFKLEAYEAVDLPTEAIVAYQSETNLIQSSDSGAWLMLDNADVYTYDLNAWDLSKNYSGGPSSANAGFFIWKDHLFAGTGRLVNVFNGSTWDDDFFPPSLAGACSQMVWASDDKLYVPRTNRVGSVEELTTFVSTDSGTYTKVNAALTLPSDMVISSMVEFGTSLAIGANSLSRPNKAYIYLWDRSGTDANSQIVIDADGVNSMIVRNNILYIQAGKRGDWYVSNGTTAQKFKEMPKTMLTNYEPDFETSPNSVTLNENGNILFGFVVDTSAENLVYPNGVYLLNPDTKALTLDLIASNTKDGSDNPISINVVYPDRSGLVVAWDYDNTTFGLDQQSRTERGTGFGTSQFYQFGTKRLPATLTGYEVHLASSLPASCTVTVYYRVEKDDAWTQWGSTMTTGQNNQQDADKTLETAQFKVETAGRSTNAPELLSLIVR